jgi:putative exosortase-associated protein (TIGR04073 family)
LFFGLAVMFLLGAMPVLDAANESTVDNRWTKFGRGCSNIVFSGTELIYQPYFMFQKERFPVALFGGVFRGAFYAVGRVAVGLYEVATFPIPLPSGYRPIIGPDIPIPKDVDTGSSAV